MIQQPQQRTNLKAALIITLSTLMACIGTMVVFTIAKLDAQKADSTVINIAGRQRMLNQRHMKEVLLKSQGVSTDYKATRKLFLSSVESLKAGGMVSLGGDKTTLLPPAQQTHIVQLLTEQMRLFNEVIQQADRILDQPNVDGYKQLNALVQETHAVANNAVTQFANEAKSKIALLVDFLYFLTFAALLVCGVSAYLVKRRIVDQLLNSSHTLENRAQLTNQGAQDLASSSEKLLNAVDEQSAAVHETIAAMTQLSSMVDSTTEAATTGQQTSQKVTQEVHTSKQQMHSMVDVVNEVNKAVDRLFEYSHESGEQTKANLKAMEEVIGGISAKVGIINDIAQKTEILSFNASIEAARAGRHGKGFSVVATEVGNLARLTAKSSDEINILVDNSRKQVSQITNSMESQVQKSRSFVDECRNLSTDALNGGQQVEANLLEIVREIERMAQSVVDIDNACKEQRAGLQQIQIAMDQYQETIETFQNIATRNNSLAERLSQDDLLNISQMIKTLISGGAFPSQNSLTRAPLRDSVATPPEPGQSQSSNEVGASVAALLQDVGGKLRQFRESDKDDDQPKKTA